jgi:hypothetical protein
MRGGERKSSSAPIYPKHFGSNEIEKGVWLMHWTSLLLALGMTMEIEDAKGKKYPTDCVVGMVGKEMDLRIKFDKLPPQAELKVLQGEKEIAKVKTDSMGKASVPLKVSSTLRMGRKSLNMSYEAGEEEGVFEINTFFLVGEPRETPRNDKLNASLNLIDTIHESIEMPTTKQYVHELSKIVNRYYNPKVHYEPEDAWGVPNTWRSGGASCISNSYYLKRVCEVLGLPGKFDTVAIYANPESPHRVHFDGVDSPKSYKNTRQGQLEWFLVDDRNTRGGRVGGWGGMNHYEGCLVHDIEGVRTYYPGGTPFAYTDPTQVLNVFCCMAWARYDARQNEWQVMEVVSVYKGYGAIRGTYVNNAPAREPLLFRGGLFRRR